MMLQNLGYLLHQCSKTKSLSHGKSLQAIIIKAGSQSDVFLSNHLINVYSKCGYIHEALKVFDEIPKRNLVTWSAIISGCYQSGKHLMALNLFSKMMIFADDDYPPNEFIYSSVISACSSLFGLKQGQQIHAHSLKSGYNSISFVSNSLISLYMNCRQCNDAFSIFSSSNSELVVDSVVSYNAMIMGFAENFQPESGLKIFQKMRKQGVLPDPFTFVGVFGICTDTKDLLRGIEFHCQAIKLGIDVTAFIGNVILTMYFKCDSIQEAEKAFDSIQVKDVISWNTIITACSHCEDHPKSIKYFRHMIREEGIEVVAIDDFTLASALAACAGLASIHHGGQIHAHIIRTRRLDLDVGVGNALVNMYAKCGNIRYSCSVFYRMVHKNLVSWNTIIAAFGNHGQGRRALDMFEQMKGIGVKPDSVTFIGLLVACNHAGFVDEGRDYFNAMKEIYGIDPKTEHVSCLIDLLGRAGIMEEAKFYVEKYQFENNLVVLGSLLSACRLHGDVVVGEWVASRFSMLQPITSSPYVLLSNLYAIDEKWEGVAEARKKLKGSGVKKEPGHSLIEIKGKVEKFTVGDFSHSNLEEMKETIRSLSRAASDSKVPSMMPSIHL